MYISEEDLEFVNEFINDYKNIKYYRGYAKENPICDTEDLVDYMLRWTILKGYIDDLMYVNHEFDRKDAIKYLRSKLNITQNVQF